MTMESSGITTRRRRRKPASGKENDDPDEHDDEDVLRQFRMAAKRVGATSLYSKELSRTIVAASLGKPFGFLLANSIDDAVSTCRQIIKKASSNKGKLELVLHPLIVTVHVLRSCWRLEHHRTTLVRLLYHATVIAADTLDILQTPNPELIIYGLGAWETLGGVLDKMQVAIGGKDSFVQCKSGDSVFPVPFLEAKGSGTCSDFEPRQFLNLGIHATMAAARIFSHCMTAKPQPSTWCNMLHHCRSTDTTTSIVIDLILEVTLPWIRILAKISDDVAGLGKSARNVIWKLASKLKGDQMKLKAFAVEAFLLHDRTQKSRVLSPALLDDACRFASQAADTSYSNMKKSKEADDHILSIAAFHEHVGALFDAKVEPHRAPESYLEYSGYRDLHTPGRCRCSSDCWLYGLPTRFRHVCGAAAATDTERVFGCFALGLSIRQHIEDSQPFNVEYRRCEDLIDGFVSSLDRVPVKQRIRFCRLFSSMDLHVAVRNALDAGIAIHETAQRSASRVLSDCICRLAFTLIQGLDKGNDERFLNLGLWSNIVSVAAMLPHEMDQQQLRRASKQIDGAPVQNRVAYGKAISGIARSRQETGVAGAVEILLEAIFVLGNLPPKASHQLGNRLSFLASLYEDRGKNNEALFATMTGLLCDIMEHEVGPAAQPEIEVVYSLSRHTKGLIPTSDDPILDVPNSKSGRVKELVRLIGHFSWPTCKSEVDLERPSLLSVPVAIDLLVQSHDDHDFVEQFKGASGTEFHFQTSMVALFHRLISNSQCQHYAAAMSVLSSILVRLGHEVQRKDSVSLIRLFENLFNCVYQSFRNSPVPESRRGVMLNLLNAAAAVSLTSNSLPPDFTNWERNRSLDSERHRVVSRILDLCEDYPDALHGADEWLQFGQCVCVALELFRSQFGRHYAEAEVIEDLERLHVIREKTKAIAASALGQTTLSRLSRLCSMNVLVRLCDLFSLRGNDLESLDVANCARSRAVDDETEAWLGSTTLSSQATDRIAQGRLLSKCNLVASDSIVGAEAEACSFRLQACSCDDDEVDAVRSELEAQLFATPVKNAPSLHISWTRTTILLGLAECHDREANLEAMLGTLLQCLEEARMLSKDLKSAIFLGGTCPSSVGIVARSMVARCWQRRNDCLSRVALVYKSFGDHKTSVQYAAKLCRSLFLCSQADQILDKDADLRGLIQQMMSRVSKQRSAVSGATLRMLMGIVAESKPCFETFPYSATLSCLKDVVSGHSEVSVENLRCVVEVLDLLNRGRPFPYIDTTGLLTACRHQLDSDSWDRHYPQVRYDFQLREAAAEMSRDCPSNEQKLLTTLSTLGARGDCTNTVRAGAFYMAGLRHLENARERGELPLLWESSCPTVSAHVEMARHSFASALRRVGSSCSTLKRNILRNFALVLGPDSDIDDREFSACTLIHASIGEATCRRNVRNRTVRGEQPGAVSKLQLFDTHNPLEQRRFFKDLLKQLKSNQRLVSIATCMSGEILLASVEYRSGQLLHKAACVFPDDDSRRGVLDDPLQCFKDIMERNSLQLQEVLNIDPTDKAEKKTWWRSRKELDYDLGSVLSSFEHSLLRPCRVRDILLGHNTGKNLADRFEEAVHPNPTLLRPDITSMKVTELVSELLESGTERKALRGLKKAQLINLLQEQRSMTPTSIMEPILFLALDERLQSFPVESIPSLQGRSICRLPSAAFALASRRATRPGDFETPSVFEPEKTTYILDPESNLSDTRERIEPLIKRYNDMFAGSWKGVVNEIPSLDLLQSSLTDRSGLMLYFGHGGGRRYLSSKVQREFTSTMILMGCSSGQLRSCNDPGLADNGCQTTLLDPEGDALTYLAAGSPCVVGNLWDVTDKDIDAFSERMMSLMFLENDNTATAVGTARDACKLRYLTGAAPVCYGLPMRARHRGCDSPCQIEKTIV